MLLSYLKKCACLSFKSSWETANNLGGAVFVGIAFIAYDKIYFFKEIGTLQKIYNSTLTLVIYTVTAWVLIFLIKTILFSPFLLWKKDQEKIFELNKLLDDRTKKREIKLNLARFLEDGQRIISQCSDENNPPPETEANSWANSVEKYFTDEMDDSYISRFRNGAGLPMTANSIASMPHRNLWAGIWIRIARLQEFIKEHTVV